MNATLIAYAAMLLGTAPDGCAVVYENHIGLDAYVYECQDERVLAIQGTRTAVDVLSIPVRRIFGYSPRYLDVGAAFGVDAVIGHSAGGGMASWIGYSLGIPSITFNPAVPIDQALLNDGAQQINVVVTGDHWSDSPENRARLAGQYVYLPAVADGVRSHPMTTVYALLTGMEP